MSERMSIDEIVKEIRLNLKNEFPNQKFSVTCRNYDVITVCLMESPENPFADYKVEGYSDRHHGAHVQLGNTIKNTCNGYHLTDQAVEMLKKVNEIGNRRNYDHSDIQSDFFDVNYYFYLHIGRWDKPFKIIARSK